MTVLTDGKLRALSNHDQMCMELKEHLRRFIRGQVICPPKNMGQMKNRESNGYTNSVFRLKKRKPT